MYNRKNNIEQFLKGEINLDEIKYENENNSAVNFIKVYKNAVKKREHKQIPEFDPFGKIIPEERVKRHNLFYRLLPYAAIFVLLILIASVFVFPELGEKQTNEKYSEQQIAEIQKETEYALLYFSKELNNTLDNIDISNVVKNNQNSIKLYKTDFENPMKNLNIN